MSAIRGHLVADYSNVGVCKTRLRPWRGTGTDSEAAMRFIDVYRRQIELVGILLYLVAFWSAFAFACYEVLL